MRGEAAEAGVFVVLLADDGAAQAAGAALGELVDGDRSWNVVVPPVRGVGFFADPDSQTELDAWWGANVAKHASPMYLLEDDDGLPKWLEGVDGTFVIGVNPQNAERYKENTRVRTVQSGDPLSLAYAAMQAVRPPTPVRSEPQRRLEDAHDLTAPCSTRDDAMQFTHPFDVLAAELAPAGGLDAATRSVSTPTLPPASAQGDDRGVHWARLAGASLLRASRRERVRGDDLAATLCERGSTIVAVGSRKGGVGKTSHAAGVAIAAGELLDRVGRRATIVDANLANPDAWGHMNLPEGAATVRQVIAALMVGHEPPLPVHAATPALACYPESRETAEYSRTEIERFASYIRARYTFTVVDMSNRLPDATGGPEASVAAYWLERADVLLLPTASSKQEFNGVLDFLDIQELPPTVVAYLTPRSRRNREHPLTRRYLEAISSRVEAVVSLPDESERVRYAVMEGIPAQDVSSSLRSAYRRLTASLIAAAARRP